MSKLGFNTGKGFHGDIEQVREQCNNIGEQVVKNRYSIVELAEKVDGIREGLLKVGYDVTSIKYNEAIEFELPEGYTISDIFGIKFYCHEWMSHFGCYSFGNNDNVMICCGFNINQATGEHAGEFGLFAEIAEVSISAVGENKFSFSVGKHYHYFSVTGTTRQDTNSEYLVNASRTIYVYFSKGVNE